MNLSNFNKMNNYLPSDLMTMILNIRSVEMEKDFNIKLEEYKEEHEEKYMYVDNQISEYFVSELAIYEHLTLEEDCKYFSPFYVLKMLREERENREIEEDFGNYYN